MKGMTPLELDPSCCNRTNWRTDLPHGLDVRAIKERFVELGYSSRCHHPALVVLRHPEGHELAWVVASGRVQVRVHITVPKEARPACARSLYRDLESCLAAVEDSAA